MNGNFNPKPYVAGAENGEVRRGNDEADLDLIRDELRYIANKKPEASHIAELSQRLDTHSNGDNRRPYLFGLALSGGGIRSATFSLGVMQRLARAGILKHVDYLSTVSGGGYIGTALSWWLSGHDDASESYDLAGRFPYGIRDPKESNQ